MAANQQAVHPDIQALTDLLTAATAGNGGAPVVAAATIGVLADRVINYTQGVVLDVTMSKARLSLRVATYAATQRVQIRAITTNAAVAALLDLAVDPASGNAVVSVADKNVCESACLIMALKCIRLAGNEGKRELDVREAFTQSTHQMCKAYDDWRAETSAADVVATVKAIQSSCATSPLVQVRLASERIAGRGFTAAGVICMLFNACVSQNAKDMVNRVFAAYKDEVTNLIALLRWLRADKERFAYSFYTGIPSEYSANKYAHLAGFGVRVLRQETLERLRGAIKNVRLPPDVMALVDPLSAEIIAVTVPGDAAAWSPVFTATMAALTANLTL